jgi:putative tricarboxylic transport membrane protein
VLPSTFPKVLAILGIVCSLVVLLGLEKPAKEEGKEPEIDWRRLHEYHLVPALSLIGLMVLYALALRPAGFLAATAGFLIAGALILGERRLLVLVPVALVAAGIVWWLVDRVLGIFLSPLPAFL